MKMLPAFVGMPEHNRIYNCEALSLLKVLPSASVDAVITDPPYGLAGRVFDFPHKHYSAVNEEWDTFAPVDWMAEVARVLKPTGSVVCFCGRRSTYIFAGEALRLGWRIINDITWIKPDAPPNFTGRMMTESTERALWFSPSGTGWTYNLNEAKTMNGGINLRDVWTFKTERDNRLHPTQKPLELMERCIRLFTNEGDLVLDCFAGSCTTLRAAANCNRRWLGCDITYDYVVSGRNRMAQDYTPALFELTA